MYRKPLPFFGIIFPYIGHCRIVSRVPCSIQQILISYLYYMEYCVYVNPSPYLLPPPPSPIPSGKHEFVFYSCLILLLFVVVAADFFF